MGRRIAPPRTTSAFATVDFDRAGKQVGFIMIPHSPHEDAWGVTRIPVAVIQNGSGPTAIVEGGNHGDEYEGPIVISELIRDLDPASIQGRLILLPAINVHAAMAGRRTSPVDGLNFNRTFPATRAARSPSRSRPSSPTRFFRAPMPFSTSIPAARRST